MAWAAAGVGATGGQGDGDSEDWREVVKMVVFLPLLSDSDRWTRDRGLYRDRASNRVPVGVHFSLIYFKFWNTGPGKGPVRVALRAWPTVASAAVSSNTLLQYVQYLSISQFHPSASETLSSLFSIEYYFCCLLDGLLGRSYRQARARFETVVSKGTRD